jgi:chromosome segregation ATPase
VVVEREILDSNVDTSGKCQVDRGKILSSQVSAKQGIEAFEIGSNTARPCALILGVDERVEREVARLGENLVRLKAKKGELENQISRLNAKSARMNKQLGDLAQVQDRAMVEQRSLKEKMTALAGRDGGPEQEEIIHQIDNLESNIAELDAAVGRLLDGYEAASLEVEQTQRARQETEERIQELAEDMGATMAWSKEVKGTPALTVKGKVFAGTSVKGPFASMVFKEDHTRITMKEMKGSPSDPTPQWKAVT